MEAGTAALLFPQGYQTTDDLENDLSLIRCKLDSARQANHARLIPQLVKKLEKREKLLQQIQYGTTALLNSWGFDSIESLRSAITETVSNLEIATADGHTEIVAEETEKLAEMQDLLCECLKASSNNHQRQSVSQIKVFPTDDMDVCGPSNSLHSYAQPPAISWGIPQSQLCENSSVRAVLSNDYVISSPNEIPECAEKSLRLLHAYFKSERVRLRLDGVQRESNHPVVPEALLKSQYERLIDQLSSEYLASNQVHTEIKECSDVFNKYVTQTNLVSGHLSVLVERIEDVLYRALRSIAPLDIIHLLDSVHTSIDAAQLIKNKDIILLLGSTGAGKSTLMHFLAGSHMRVTEIDGIEHLEPEGVMTGMEDVSLSCSSRSETTGIRAINMHFNEKNYTVCDTAGLGDTRGPEQDITSGIVMTNAIRSARSVKVVLLITQGAISDRYSNLRKTLVPSITRLIPTFGDQVSSIFYLFNMISDRIEGVAARLRNFSSQLEPAEKADVSFTAMVTDLARKAQMRTQCAVVDMVDGSNLELLKAIDSVEAIQNPSEVFRDFAAPASINVLNDQLRSHQAIIFQSLTRYVASGEREILPIINFKLFQLLDLHVTIGLSECTKVYFTCIQELSTTVQNLYLAVYNRIEKLFAEGVAVGCDIELEKCIDVVVLLLELIDVSTRHSQHRDRADQDGGLRGFDMKGMIAALFKRMMKNSGEFIANYVTALVKADPNTAEASDLDSSAVGRVASSHLEKMRSLSLIPNRVDLRVVAGLGGVFGELQQMFESQISDLVRVIADLVNDLHNSLLVKRYIDCLHPLVQLKALEQFNLSPHTNMHDAVSRARCLFLDGITSDCEDARRGIDENFPGCVEAFCITVQRVLEVIARPAFLGVVSLDRLHIALDRLTGQVAMACNRAEIEFQFAFSSHDLELFSKLKIKASFIHLLRENAFVSQATAASQRLLFNSVKIALESYYRQASKMIRSIAKEEMHTDSDSPSPLGLKALLLMIHDASTFGGELQDVYRGELELLISDSSSIVDALSHYVGNGENGKRVSYRGSDTLKSLYSRRRSVALLSGIVDGECSERVPALSGLYKNIIDSLQACDSSVTRAAMQGITQIKSLLAVSASQVSSDSFKRNILDALNFITTAESLGFNLHLSEGQKSDVVSVNAYFVSVGDWIVTLLRLHHRGSGQSSANSVDIFDGEAALEIKKCFAFLKSFEILMSQSSSPCLVCMKESIEGALARSTTAALSLLTDLNNHAEGRTSSARSPSGLTSLCEDFQICNLLSVLDELLLSADCNLKFISTAYKFKSAISQISISTRHKIPTHDFDGVLNELKNFNRDDPLIAVELRGILQEVYATLSIMLKRDFKTAESFRLGMTSHEATEALLKSLREIAEKSSLFVTYLAVDQADEFAKIKCINDDISKALHLICSDCKSRVDDLKVRLDESSFYEAEVILAGATTTLPLLVHLARYIKTLNTTKRNLSPQSSLTESAPSVDATITLTKEVAQISQRKKDSINRVLSSILKHYWKPVSIAQVKAVAPNKLLDDMKRAEQFGARYNIAAKSLMEHLFEDVTSTLKSVQGYICGDPVAMDVEEEGGSDELCDVMPGPRVGAVKKPLRPSSRSITSLKDCEDIVKSVELFTPYFPLELFERYQSDLAVTKSMVEAARRTHEIRMNEAINTGVGDCQGSLDLFNQYKEASDFTHMKEVGDRLHIQQRVLIRTIMDDLGAGKLLSVLTFGMPLHWNWISYVDQLQLWRDNPRRYSHFLQLFRMLHWKNEKFDVDPPIELLAQLIRSFMTATNSIITRLNNSTAMQLAELEPLLDGLCAMLSPGAEVIWHRILKLDSTLRNKASNAVLSIAKLFFEIAIKINKSADEVTKIMSITVGQSIADVKVLGNGISFASKLLVVAKQSTPLLLKMKALLNPRHSILSNSDYEQFSSMELPSYDEMNTNINSTVELIQRVARPSLLDNQLLITPNASDRNHFYHRVQIALTLLIRWDADQAIANGCVNNRANEENCRDKLSSEIESIGCAADRLVNTTDYQRFGVLYDNLRSISENLSDNVLKDRAVGRMKSIDSLFFQRIEVMRKKGWLNEAEWNSNPFGDHFYERVANELIDMKTATTHVALYKKRVDEEYIDALLADYKARPTGLAGRSFFLGLSIYLGGIRTSDAPIASQILSEHSVFAGHKLLLRNERILRFTVEDMLHDITGDDEASRGQQLSKITKVSLRQVSKMFEKEYWAIVEAGLENREFLENELEAIVEKTKNIAGSRHIPRNEKIRRLMAHIFAYWTLSESEHFQQSKSRDEKAKEAPLVVKRNAALLQPHSGQIVGILRLFGLDEKYEEEIHPDAVLDGGEEEKKDDMSSCDTLPLDVDDMESIDPGSNQDPPVKLKYTLKNHIVEIGTGEGKSVTLAVSAMLLALLGLEVDVVCYSEYLTDRDDGAFRCLFCAFDVSTLINYGTFKTMSEKFINRRGCVRGGLRAAISGNATQFKESNNATGRVLLVDEMDVFFNSKLYLSSYCPITWIQGTEVTAFIKMLWAVYKKGDIFAIQKGNVIRWPVYVACLEKYLGWEFFTESSLDELLSGLTHFDKPYHNYHFDSTTGRIGYKSFDGISYGSYRSTWTLFAYFKEHDNGKVTAAALEKHIALTATGYQFSYAAMLKTYDNILGVSGTLRELSDSQRKVLSDEYDVKNATYLRSVYGRNKLCFDANSAGAIKITNIAEFYKEIVNEICSKLVGRIKSRAVFVFLKTKKEVDDFLASPSMNELRGQVRVIREEDTADDRELTVRQAVTSKSITVMSCDFGRGTDFICFDNDLDASGGVHVIQTFVSQDVSEERQIKGRTARQGNQGSYSMVLLDSQLEDIGISMDMIRQFEESGQRYTEIDRRRRDFCDATFAKSLASLDKVSIYHKRSLDLLQALYRNDVRDIIKLYKKLTGESG